ncbi:MAG: tetratricopeptide repeat protein [Candidatus Aminicenantes bacterium]|nr:tetratricopeptide repeat protein [Candidatus Aminicenantes bacterium]
MVSKKLLVTGLLFSLLLILPSCFSLKKIGSPAEFNLHLNRAIAFMQDSQYQPARQELFQAIAINPKSARAHNLIGLTYFRENNYDQAEFYFSKAIKIDPNYYSGYINLASTYAMKELYKKARDYYEKAVELSPDQAGAYYGLATIYFQLGNKEKGIVALNRALDLAPDFLEKHAEAVVGLPMKGSALPELYFALARLYAGRNDLEKTVENLEKARRYGFKNWELINHEPEFASLRDNPRIKEFTKSKEDQQ